MQEKCEHPTVRPPAKAPSNVGLEDPPAEEGESAAVLVASTTPTKYSDCEPHGFGSTYGYSPR